jgi:hypothetical protein
MSSNQAKREALRQWLAEKSGKITPKQLSDDLPIIERRVITSLQFMDLLLFIEALRGMPVHVHEITPRAFASINAICEVFLEGGHSCA